MYLFLPNGILFLNPRPFDSNGTADQLGIFVDRQLDPIRPDLYTARLISTLLIYQLERESRLAKSLSTVQVDHKAS